MEFPALPAGLPGENDVGDFHPFIEGFAHVVDCEGRSGNGDQGFHFHARLGGRRNCGSHFHAILAQPCGHINVRQREWMTKRYPLRGLLGGGDSRNSRHFQGIPFRIFQPAHCGHDSRLHLDKSLRGCRSCRHRLCRHVDHPHFAFLSVVGELGHDRANLNYILPQQNRNSLADLDGFSVGWHNQEAIRFGESRNIT